MAEIVDGTFWMPRAVAEIGALPLTRALAAQHVAEQSREDV
jgi:hypothetical protein